MPQLSSSRGYLERVVTRKLGVVLAMLHEPCRDSIGDRLNDELHFLAGSHVLPTEDKRVAPVRVNPERGSSRD